MKPVTVCVLSPLPGLGPRVTGPTFAHPGARAHAATCHLNTAQVRAFPVVAVAPSSPPLHRKLGSSVLGRPALPHISGPPPHTAPLKQPTLPLLRPWAASPWSWSEHSMPAVNTFQSHSPWCAPGKLKSHWVFKESSSLAELLSMSGASAEGRVAQRGVTGSPTALGEPETHSQVSTLRGTSLGTWPAPGAPLRGSAHRCPFLFPAAVRQLKHARPSGQRRWAVTWTSGGPTCGVNNLT